LAFLGQTPLNTNAIATLTTPVLSSGTHVINASYVSDTVFASSTGNLIGTPTNVTALLLNDGSVQLSFSNWSAAPFSVLGATDLSLPLSNWSVLGPATEFFPVNFSSRTHR